MNASPSLDDIRRARYDRLLFATERCKTESHVASHDSVESKQRWRMLELGAMGMLEAELEALSVTASSTREQECCGRELENLKSCMLHLLDRHYDNLDVLDRSDDFHDTLNDPASGTVSPLVKQGSAECGDVSHSVEVATLLSRLPALGRDTKETQAGGQAPTSKPAAGVAGVGGCASAATHNDIRSTSHGGAHAVGIKRSEAREAFMVNPAEDFANTHPSSDTVYGDVPSAGALARRPGQAAASTLAGRQKGPPLQGVPGAQPVSRQRVGVGVGVEPSAAAPMNPYRVEEAGRRGVNGRTAQEARAAPGVPDNRHIWGDPTSSRAPVARQASLYGEISGSRGVSEGGVRGAAASREAGERTWRREGSDERHGGVLGAGAGNRQNPFKTARELRAADNASNGGIGGIGGKHAAGDRGERGWDERDTNGRHSSHGWERPQGRRRWGGDLDGGSAYNDAAPRAGNENRSGSCHDSERTSYSRDQGTTTISPRPSNSSGLVRKRKFVPPGRLDGGGGGGGGGGGSSAGGSSGSGKFPGAAAMRGGAKNGGGEGEDELPEELQHLEKAMVEKIMQEVQQRGDPVTFDQIAGLEFAKKSVIEVVCWPMERPDIFVGLRALPKGLLLFGPPGTGKTLIGKAIAHQSGATFFSISASSLCSKWIGEGEKMVRTLFAVAAYHQPAVIFIDEVDSMLSMRSADENEASRRLKTEFLIQLDGAGTKARDRVLVVGATNRPQELDEAARRRFVKRLYVPLPDKSGRRQLINILLKTSVNNLTPRDIEEVVEGTEGFSGADLHSLCTEAAMGPVRELGSSICSIKASDVPPMEARHFTYARQCMRPSVGAEEITQYVAWNEDFGSFKRQ